MDIPPRGTLVRAADVRRPPWPAAVAGRRPSGQESVPRPRDRRRTRLWTALLVASLTTLVLLRLVAEQGGARVPSVLVLGRGTFVRSRDGAA